MSERDLFGDLVDEAGHVVEDDYHEDWEPSAHSCWDCAHVERHGLLGTDRCSLIDREVDRVAGFCRNFKPFVLKQVKRCGECAHADWSRPGCEEGFLGRCMEPRSPSYMLAPKNTGINACLPEGHPERNPPDGSWGYVAPDSVGCGCFQSRRKA